LAGTVATKATTALLKLARATLAAAPPIGFPTTMLPDAETRGKLPVTSRDKETCFTGGYERRLLDGVGHFVPREAPEAFSDAILAISDRPH
jgi:pimeloyl-ACP methyl ester carboxylesterase